MLAPANLGLLYIGMVIAKLVHEFGHAAACKRFGGEVHKMGVMLLMFAPLPYMDATASWGFRSRFQRLLVGVSGVLSELAVAAVAACGFTVLGVTDCVIHGPKGNREAFLHARRSV